MKKCPACGQFYEDIYTRCFDGQRLIGTNETPPPTLAPANAWTTPAAGSQSLSARAKKPSSNGAGLALFVVACLACGGAYWYFIWQHRATAPHTATSAAVPQPTLAAKATTGPQGAPVAQSKVGPQAAGQSGVKIGPMGAATSGEAALEARKSAAKTLEMAAAQAAGQTKATLQACAQVMRSEAAVFEKLSVANRLRTEGLDMAGVETRDQMRTKKSQVFKACGMMEEFANFDGEQALRRDLQSAHLLPEAIAKVATKRSQALATADRQYATAARECARTSRAMANLLEINWGKWKFDKEQKKVTFTDQKLGASYKNTSEALEAAERSMVTADTADAAGAKKFAEEKP